jgi:uncharacterized protein (TIGR00725 family)
VPRQPEKHWRVAVVELRQRLLPALGHPLQQLAVVEATQGGGDERRFRTGVRHSAAKIAPGEIEPACRRRAKPPMMGHPDPRSAPPGAPTARPRSRLQVAVVGPADCDASTRSAAERVGALLGLAGAVVLTGGRGGVMAAASRGAAEAGGVTVGVLPGPDAAATPPDEAVQITLFTGLGQARNQVLVLSAAAVIAVGAGWGTLSEIALACKHGIPVVLLESWELRRPGGEEPGLLVATTPEEAVAQALAAARGA